MTTSPSPYVATTMAALQEPSRAQADALLQAWLCATGNRPYGRPWSRCLQHLSNPAHRCGLQCWPQNWPRVLDHPERWTAPNGALVVTAHPYNVSDADRAELTALAQRTGARLEIDPAGSWYWPGVTVLVVLTGCPSAKGAASMR